MVLSTHVVNLDDVAGSGGGTGVKVFLDAKLNVNVDTTEKTNFYPGDTANLLAVIPSDLLFVRAELTDPAGAVTDSGLVDRNQVDRLFFLLAENRKELSRVPVGSASAGWFGRNGVLNQDGAEVWVKSAPAVADVRYSFRARSLQVKIPSGLVLGENEQWPIGLVVYVRGVADGG